MYYYIRDGNCFDKSAYKTSYKMYYNLPYIVPHTVLHKYFCNCWYKPIDIHHYML